MNYVPTRGELEASKKVKALTAEEVKEMQVNLIQRSIDKPHHMDVFMKEVLEGLLDTVEGEDE